MIKKLALFLLTAIAVSAQWLPYDANRRVKFALDPSSN